jgi:peptidoglycan/LPS O-acetylase OafA/YrhL
MHTQKQYFPALDVLRFFAAGWVMLFHYFLFFSGDLHFYRFGNLGVQLFFIISGFVIAESIQGKTLKQFAHGRFVRLFPIFWVACTITYLFTLWAGSGVRFSTYLVNMTMIGFNAIKDQSVDPVYWSLTVELFFYGFIALFVALFTFKRIRALYIGWLALATIFFACGWGQATIAKLLLIRHASYFIFGGLLFLMVEAHIQGKMQRAGDILLLAYAAVFSIYVLPMSNPAYFSPNAFDSFFTILIHILYFTLVPILIIMFRNPSKSVMKVTLLLGGLTYPFYLIHQRIGLILIDRLKPYMGSFGVHALVMLIILLGSYGLYRLDRHMRKWFKVKRIDPTSPSSEIKV